MLPKWVAAMLVLPVVGVAGFELQRSLRLPAPVATPKVAVLASTPMIAPSAPTLPPHPSPARPTPAPPTAPVPVAARPLTKTATASPDTKQETQAEATWRSEREGGTAATVHQ